MRTLIVIAAVLLGAAANAQYWRALGRGTIGPTEVQTLYGDSISDRLLAGGTFMWILNEEDTLLGMGQAAWNGTRWDSLAHRIQPVESNIGTQQTYWFLRFQGRLYACGSFSLPLPGGGFSDNLARLNEPEQRWEDLGCIIPNTAGIQQLVPKEPGDQLYATGYMGYSDQFCGLPTSCVFRYDGESFHPWPPFHELPEYANSYVGYVFDYKGKTYITGTFRDPYGPGLQTFLRWNGSSWEHVPGWNTQSAIKEILIRNDILYVAGAFRYATNGPGNLIAAFDGETWDDMGGGLLYTPVPMSSVVLDLEWFHDELWACGRFNTAGGVPAHSIAKWDGNRWCMPPGDFRWIYNSDSELVDMTVWRDSLYVCGGILTVDGDTMKKVVQWLGGDTMEACSPGVGIAEIPEPDTAGNLQAIPSGTPGRWTVHLPKPGSWSLEVYDAAGRRIKTMATRANALVLDLAGASPGMYMLRAHRDKGSLLYGKVLLLR